MPPLNRNLFRFRSCVSAHRCFWQVGQSSLLRPRIHKSSFSIETLDKLSNSFGKTLSHTIIMAEPTAADGGDGELEDEIWGNLRRCGAAVVSRDTMASRRSTARKILGRHGSSRQRDSSRASAAFRLRIGRPSRWPRLSHRTVAKTSTRLGSSSLEVRLLFTPAALHAISRHVPCPRGGTANRLSSCPRSVAAAVAPSLSHLSERFWLSGRCYPI